MSDKMSNVLSRLAGVRPCPNGYEARCPAHSDQHASLSVSRGNDGRVLLVCHAGCPTLTVLRAAGLTWADVAPGQNGARPRGPQGKIVATYDYHDAAGETLYQVVRFEPKDFRQRRPDGAGGWTWNLGDTPRVLYRMRELLAADQAEWVYIVEGEKDVDALRSISFTATCNPGGAGKWSKLADGVGADGAGVSWRAALAGRRIVIVPDADDPGRRHAADVARRVRDVAATVRILTLPGPGKDVADWLAAGGTPDHLRALADAAPEPDDDSSHTSCERVFSPSDPLPIARAFISAEYSHADGQTLVRHRGDWWRWNGQHYALMATDDLRAGVYHYLGGAHRIDKRTGDLIPFGPKRSSVGDAIEAIESLSILPTNRESPCWLDDRPSPRPRDLVYCGNTMLDPISGATFPHTPRMFSQFASAADYDPEAPRPDAWMCFLEDLWGGDRESINALQEYMGYCCLTPDTSQQKALLVVGPKRSGKGTIQRVLASLVGEQSFASMRLDLLTNDFALEGAIGKSVLAFPDARVTRDSSHAALELLLSIIGEDFVPVNRKGRPVLTMRLGCRVAIFSNELPQFRDASGAIASRFIVLRLRESFYGRENLDLGDKLAGELPGILLWCIDGLRRLRQRGRFAQPASALDDLRLFSELASPITAFLDECCMLDAEATVETNDLYAAWRAWCDKAGHRPTAKSVFARDLRAAQPTVTAMRAGSDIARTRMYTGICLSDHGRRVGGMYYA